MTLPNGQLVDSKGSNLLPVITPNPITEREKRVYRSHKERIGDSEYSAWLKAQRDIAIWLDVSHGIKTQPCEYASPYDLITDTGVRIEVKASGMTVPQRQENAPSWLFNIHRHGVLCEDEVDAYILRCEIPTTLVPILGKASIHLVVPAPIGVKTLRITPRSLMTRWGRAFNKFSNLRRRSK